MKSLALVLPLVAGLWLAPGFTDEVRQEERKDFGRFYEEAGVTGTFLLYDLRENTYLSYAPERTDQAVIPASTFKIFNSLVALETGVIPDAETVIPWDGVDRGFEGWNRDHTLRTAFRASAVWFYQELARRIGPERMQHYVDRAGYGNQDLGGKIDGFWLDGDLRISPRQQIALLVGLYRNTLPFSQRSMDLVKDILVLEADGYVLRGKTGWAGGSEPQVGWFVGYLETGGNAYFFANQIDIRRDEDAPARIAVTRRILASLGLLGF